LTRKRILTIVAAIAVLAALAIFWKPVQGYLGDVLAWVDTLGAWAPVAFVLIVAMSVPLVLPGLLFTLAAGAMFGLVRGVVLIILGLSIGGIVSFLLGRYVFRDWARNLLQRHPAMSHLESEVTLGGWKLIMFTRMVPLFPFKISNYVFGCTRVKLWEYWLGNTIGILPITFTNVYTGSLLNDLASVGDGDAPRSTTEWVLSLCGLAFAVFGLIYITRYARRAMRSYKQESSARRMD
jgi:uncharacterized membrane protein YdjX (TVP38/TMEM64 family)